MNSKQPGNLRREWPIYLGLLVLTLTAFWPVGRLGFILYDDYGENGYVVDNPHIRQGITVESIHWAFTTTRASNWHPVTWLSHMLDYQLFGLNAGGQHWMNLGLHVANTWLLFLVLGELTGTRWRSALVAAWFGLHPTHLQSVAWISERKDVLSGFFFMLTLFAYVRYAEQSKVRSPKKNEKGETSTGLRCVTPRQDIQHRKSDIEHSTFNVQHSTFNVRWWYWAAVFVFALGLMSKPMLVTVPVILLLLDYWPLRRISEFGVRSSELKNAPQLPGAAKRGEARRSRLSQLRPSTLNAQLSTLLLEKLPFFVLSLASSIVTVRAQGVSVIPLTYVPWDERIENALVSYAVYLGKLFWPVNLAIFYPYERTPAWEGWGSALILILVTILCIRQLRPRSYLPAGWFWFLLMLVPVISLVQVSVQSMADRYLYLPSIGIFIMAAWGMAELASRSRLWRSGMTLGATALVLACLLDTRYQLRYWRDSVTLFRHALAVTGENPMGHYFLGNALWVSGDLDEAADNYRAVLRTAPDSEDVHYRLGYILLQQKKFEAAGNEFAEVLRLNPNNAFACKFLGDTLAARGQFTEAEAEYTAAQQLQPDDEVIRNALAGIQRKIAEEKTLDELYEALKRQPTAEVHVRIAVIRAAQGAYAEAADHYRAALRLAPDSPEALNNLAWLLATCPEAKIRNGPEAVQSAERACELTQTNLAPLVGTLAAAYAEAGRFDEATATAEKACALAGAANEPELLKRNQELLDLYRRHQPYHEQAGPEPAGPSNTAPAAGR